MKQELHSRDLTLNDLVIAPDNLSARYGFIQYRLTRVDEDKWRWVTNFGKFGYGYSSPPFRLFEDAPKVLKQTVSEFRLRLSVSY